MPGLRDVPYTQYALANGLTVILTEERSSPVAAVMVMYHAGSKNEIPGRTGLAHLFEHLMFKGSLHVGDGEHFRLLQEIGASVNATTSEDRTNYFEAVPSHELELALYLESDRMGFLPGALNQSKLDNQRDVVRNERRQSYDNVPYGTAYEKTSRAVYGATHPYGWPVIGWMDDLAAATLEDAKGFFGRYYAPGNACLVVAGDFDRRLVGEWIEKYFGAISAGPAVPRLALRPPPLADDATLIFEEPVQLPRLYLTWPASPRGTRGEALMDLFTTILTSGKSSRLYRPLVFEEQIAQSVSAYADGKEIAGTVSIEATARPGTGLGLIEERIRNVLDDMLTNGVTEREIASAFNGKEAQLAAQRTTMLAVAGGLATAFTLRGDTAAFNRELERFSGVSPDEITAEARKVFSGPRVALNIVPAGGRSLAASPRKSRPTGGNNAA
ncbi:MAG TPA: pitrilysin family protein [Bacteroidota bacterium]|nr:pitrilysin family protein [Bacteroidota bacterium]